MSESLGQTFHLIVPMAGYGSRFREAGYEDYKPFIKINGKPMIDYVLEAFPEEVQKHLIINPELVSPSERKYLLSKKNVLLHEIEGHKLGPAYSIFQARDKLPVGEKWFVSYCDIAWTWDFEEVKKFTHHDGIIFTRQKFHPHLVNNNFSAFCRVDKSSSPPRLEEIKEKGSFTKDWMNEPLSVGVFFVKRGVDLVQAIADQIKNQEKVAAEYFPSTSFNSILAENGKSVVTLDVDFFIHWGVPSQLKDYLNWNEVFKASAELMSSRLSFENIMCMGGTGARMKGISDKPKALIPIQNMPMFEYVLNQIPAPQHSLITVDSLVNELNPKALMGREVQKISVGAQTKSQIETLARASDFLATKSQFFLSSCDAFGMFDSRKFQEFVEAKNPDAVIFTFEAGLLVNSSKTPEASHHTHVSVEGDRITAVHIKSFQKASDPGLAGLFWFKSGSAFNGLRELVSVDGRELVVDHFLKEMVASGARVCAYPLKAYVHLGTPDELNEFFFWQEHAFALEKAPNAAPDRKGKNDESNQVFYGHTLL